MQPNQTDAQARALPVNDRVRSQNDIADSIGALLIALCPILQHYRGIVLDASELVLCLLFPYLLFKLLSRKKLEVLPIIPLALYWLYISFHHGFDPMGFARETLLALYFLAAINGCAYMPKVLKASCMVCACASVLIIVQYVCYYVLHFHLQMVPTGLLVDSAEQWILLAQTGRISVTGAEMSFYRPSAFFLEPSHLAIYFIPSLLVLVLAPGINRRRLYMAMLLSAGILLSTSGIGIAAVVGVWGLYGAFYHGKTSAGSKVSWRDLFQPSHLLFVAVMLILLVVMYFSVDLFRSSVRRIFIGSDGGNSAIQGRTISGIRSLGEMSGMSLLIGWGKEISLAQRNMAGFFYTLSKHGLIGCALSYLFYAECLRLLKREYFWLAAVVVGLSFFTVHTYAAFYRMYFISILLHGFRVIRARDMQVKETHMMQESKT